MPSRCTWATLNCCDGQSLNKRDQCFSIFSCRQYQQRQDLFCTPENIRQAMYDRDSFLNSDRKK